VNPDAYHLEDTVKTAIGAKYVVVDPKSDNLLFPHVDRAPIKDTQGVLRDRTVPGSFGLTVLSR
jgi:hypothetical protein